MTGEYVVINEETLQTLQEKLTHFGAQGYHLTQAYVVPAVHVVYPSGNTEMWNPVHVAIMVKIKA